MNNRPQGSVWAKPCPMPTITPLHCLRRLAYTFASKATRREALRARAFELVAADRLTTGRA